MGKYKKFIVPIAVLLLALTLTTLKKCADRPVVQPVGQDYKVPEVTYRPPVVKIPGVTKDRQPIPDERLPIKKENIDKTVVVTTKDESGTQQKVEIIIDKKGNVYLPTDTPPETTAVVTKWKPPLMAFTVEPGVAIVFAGKTPFYCLSLDLVRIGRFYIGPDIGVVALNFSQDFLVGVSVKYHIADITVGSDTLYVSVLGGYDLLKQRAYFGGHIRW